MLDKKTGTRSQVLEKHQRMVTMIEKTKVVIDGLMLPEPNDVTATKMLVDNGVVNKQGLPVLTLLTFLNVIDDIMVQARSSGETDALDHFFKTFQKAVQKHEDEFVGTLQAFVIAMLALDRNNDAREPRERGT